MTVKERVTEKLMELSIKKLVKKLANEPNCGDNIVNIKNGIKHKLIEAIYSCRSDEEWEVELDVDEVFNREEK